MCLLMVCTYRKNKIIKEYPDVAIWVCVKGRFVLPFFMPSVIGYTSLAPGEDP
jgi:hypothetical protein